MKHLLLTTIAAVVLVGYGPSVPDISIHIAARDGNIEAVKKHLIDSMDVKAKGSRSGSALLHQAGRNEYKEIAELLIANGEDVNAKDEDGETPLDWVVMQNHNETADLLRKHGGKTGEQMRAKETK